MTDEDLTELAHRLWLIRYRLWAQSLRVSNWDLMLPKTRASWLEMASECVRQMEWARRPEPMVAGLVGCACGQMHVAGHPVFQSPGHRRLEVGERMPLTLAPPDWQP